VVEREVLHRDRFVAGVAREQLERRAVEPGGGGSVARTRSEAAEGDLGDAAELVVAGLAGLQLDPGEDLPRFQLAARVGGEVALEREQGQPGVGVDRRGEPLLRGAGEGGGGLALAAVEQEEDHRFGEGGLRGNDAALEAVGAERP